ncbi:lytic polysaccharide monooxygenase, partial [Aplosporella prunicola CBS 121167]
MPSMMKSAALFGAFAASAMAHGTVSGIVADGTYSQGYNPSMQYQSPAPKVVGWSIPQDQDNGFVAPDAYADADIICHKGATNGQAVADVKAGGTVDFQWTTWPESHHGPVITYMANCGGDCTTADKKTLKWNKIDAKGLIDGSSAPGTWATDNMISNNNTWTTTIPDSIAAGQYVLRHEIIALHSAGQENGAQNYPQCVNVKVTGSGTEDLSSTGTLGTALYKADDAGIKISIYSSLSDYEIPGPAMWTGASSGSSTAATT